MKRNRQKPERNSRMPKIVKIAEYSKREVFTPLTLSQVVQTFFFLVISLLVCNKVNEKRSNVSPGTSSSSTSSVCVGTCAPSVAAKSETAKQLLSYKYIAVKISMRK